MSEQAKKESVHVKNCPFCGSNHVKQIERKERFLFSDECFFEVYIECRECFCKGPTGNTWSEAEKLWNSRSPNKAEVVVQ
jgi:hypothetical protein